MTDHRIQALEELLDITLTPDADGTYRHFFDDQSMMLVVKVKKSGRVQGYMALRVIHAGKTVYLPIIKPVQQMVGENITLYYKRMLRQAVLELRPLFSSFSYILGKMAEVPDDDDTDAELLF